MTRPLAEFENGIDFHFQFNFYYSHFNKIFTSYIVRQEYTNKGQEEGKKKKRKLMAWVEVYGGQRSLAFELTTAIRVSSVTLFNFP